MQKMLLRLHESIYTHFIKSPNQASRNIRKILIDNTQPDTVILDVDYTLKDDYKNDGSTPENLMQNGWIDYHNLALKEQGLNARIIIKPFGFEQPSIDRSIDLFANIVEKVEHVYEGFCN